MVKAGIIGLIGVNFILGATTASAASVVRSYHAVTSTDEYWVTLSNGRGPSLLSVNGTCELIFAQARFARQGDQYLVPGEIRFRFDRAALAVASPELAAVVDRSGLMVIPSQLLADGQAPFQPISMAGTQVSLCNLPEHGPSVLSALRSFEMNYQGRPPLKFTLPNHN